MDPSFLLSNCWSPAGRNPIQHNFCFSRIRCHSKEEIKSLGSIQHKSRGRTGGNCCVEWFWLLRCCCSAQMDDDVLASSSDWQNSHFAIVGHQSTWHALFISAFHSHQQQPPLQQPEHGVDLRRGGRQTHDRTTSCTTISCNLVSHLRMDHVNTIFNCPVRMECLCPFSLLWFWHFNVLLLVVSMALGASGSRETAPNNETTTMTGP